MAYIKTIALSSGDDLIVDGIKYYLDLLNQGKNGGKHLVWDDTTIILNDVEFPIGYFDETNIELFIDGFITVSSMRSWIYVNKAAVENGTADLSAIWELSEKYAEKLVDYFKDTPSYLEGIFKGFKKIFEEDKVPMFSDQYNMLLKERIEDLRRAAYEKIMAKSKQNH